MVGDLWVFSCSKTEYFAKNNYVRGTIYFTTDTHRIFLDGVEYGGVPETENNSGTGNSGTGNSGTGNSGSSNSGSSNSGTPNSGAPNGDNSGTPDNGTPDN